MPVSTADDTASIAARVPPTSIKFAWTVRPFCSNCYPFLGLVESFIRYQLQFDQAGEHRPIVSCSLVPEQKSGRLLGVRS